MRLFAAAIAGVLLFAASFGLLVWADEPTDLAAIAAGTGLVLSGAMLGLTYLAWRWRTGARAYTAANGAAIASDPAFYDDLASAFDSTTEGYRDASAG